MSDHTSDSSPVGPYAHSAHVYSANGWHPLPVLDRGKGQVPAGFTGYSARKVTGDDITRWVDEQGMGGSNVCLRLMYEVGIDIDSYDDTKKAREAWDDLCRTHGEPPPTVRVSARFGDGYDGLAGIKLFRLPRKYWHLAEQRVWQGQAGSGIDLIRLGHRQVVAWPSVHPKRGTVYRWLDERTGEIHDGPLPAPETLPELPTVWVEKVLLKTDTEASHSRESRLLGMSDGSSYWTSGKSCQAVETTLGKALRELEHGRHDCALKHMTALTRLGEQGHQGVLPAIDRLRGAFLLSTGGENRDNESEWDRMAAGVNAVIEADGLTPPHNRGCCTGSAEDAAWPSIMSLEQSARDAFPIDALPAGMREAVEEVARTRMVDPAVPAVAFLGAAAGAVGAYLNIEINSSWRTSGNLYLGVVAETGDGKSPGTAPALWPLQHLEEQRREEAADARRQARVRLPAVKAELKQLSDSAKPDANKILRAQRDIEDLERALRNDPRLLVDDVTPERMAELLHDNDGRLMAFNDEGGLLLHLLGMYSKDPNLGPFLKAWDGSTLTMDRKGGNGRERTALVVKRPRLTMVAAVQPRTLSLMGESRQQWLRERGVLGRILFAWPTSLAGTRKLASRTIDERLFAVDRWNNHLLECASEVLEDTWVAFTPGAYDRFVTWHDQIEENLPVGEVYSDVKDFAVKTREQAARIAGLFAYLEHDADLANDTEDEPLSSSGPDVLVREHHVMRAITLGDYFLHTAIAVVESWQGDPVILAERLVAKIHKNGKGTFTVRDACRWVKSKKDAVLPALELLQHHGYIRPSDPGAGFGRLDDRRVGQKSPKVVVNPALWSA